MQLTYNSRNPIGHGCLEEADEGLSRFGRRVVGRLVELGVAIDVADARQWAGNRRSG